MNHPYIPVNIYLYHQYLLCAYNVADTLQDARDSEINKTWKILAQNLHSYFPTWVSSFLIIDFLFSQLINYTEVNFLISIILTKIFLNIGLIMALEIGISLELKSWKCLLWCHLGLLIFGEVLISFSYWLILVTSVISRIQYF